MDVEDLVRSYLLADTTIEGLVDTRIYPKPQPERAAYPLITMQQISDVQSPYLRQRGPGIARIRLQIEAWDTTKSGMKRLARAIQHRLQGFVGRLSDTTISPPVQHLIWIEYETSFDTFEEDVNGGYWRRSADYFVGHQGTAI